MKIAVISCSPRKGKSTKYALEVCLQAVKETIPDAETALIELSEMKINGCLVCGKCMKVLECSRDGDFVWLEDCARPRYIMDAIN